MKTRIFAHRGVVGAVTDMENGKFINDPMGGGQLGCVIDVNEVEMTTAAKEAIRGAGREGGSFAPIMLTQHADEVGGASIGLFGRGFHLFHGEDLKIGRTCDLSVLDQIEINDDLEIPQREEFESYVDSLIDG